MSMVTPDGQAVDVTFSRAKAYAAAVIGFVSPGAAYLIGVAGDGVTGNEWLVAGLTCIAGGAISGGVVYAVENKPRLGNVR